MWLCVHTYAYIYTQTNSNNNLRKGHEFEGNRRSWMGRGWGRNYVNTLLMYEMLKTLNKIHLKKAKIQKHHFGTKLTKEGGSQDTVCADIIFGKRQAGNSP